MKNIFAIVIVLFANGCATHRSEMSETCSALVAGKADLALLVTASDRASEKYDNEPNDANLESAAEAAATAAQAAADLAVMEDSCETSRRAP